MEEAPIAPIRSWRPRFSLLTVLLLMTIAGMGISLRQLWHEVGPLRADNKRISEERGTLVIRDPNQLHAIEIPARYAGEGRQSFRVFVPPGQTYLAFVQVNEISKVGLPAWSKLHDYMTILGGGQGKMHARLDPGEHVVTIKTTLRDGRADIVLMVGTGSPKDFLDVSANTPRDRWPTTTPETYTVFGGGVGASTVPAEGTEPLVLLRQRIFGVAGVTQIHSYSIPIPEPDYPLDGVLLWLERAPK
jgi:hypothetical protein